MENLKELLSKLNAESTELEVVERFKEIANKLINNFQLKSVSDDRFDIVEIELYFRSKKHNDNSVHFHSYEAGIWRVHYSGIDLTLKSSYSINKDNNKAIETPKKFDEKSFYGGILFRTICNENEFVTGPLRVQTRLFSGGKLEEAKGVILVPRNTKDPIIPVTTMRQGISTSEQYCFYNPIYLEKLSQKNKSQKRFPIL